MSTQEQLLETINFFCEEDIQGFSKSDFKGTNLLIQVLRESASKQSLKSKTAQLITKENALQQIIEDISSVYSEQLDSLLENPKLYGVQLQYLRSNITAAKKKITTTKQYLQKNEKNLEQLNYNSVFNKMIYNRLKAVETQVSRFQLASSFLKSKRYLDCALSIPQGEGKSLLEENIKHKAKDLKNQLSLAICLQLYNFCFLTGNVILPTQNTMLQRIKENRGEWDMHEAVPKMQTHQKLYEKYKILKNIDLITYVKSLWKFEDFKNQTGDIAVLHDAVKAAFHISKAQKLKQFIFLNVRKAISNIYLLLSIFQIYQFRTNAPASQPIKPKTSSITETFYQVCQFTNPQKLQRINQFFISSIALGIIIIRKLILVELIYSSFQMVQHDINFKLVINLILTQLKNSLHDMFFVQYKSNQVQNVQVLKSFILKQYTQIIKCSLLYFPYLVQSLRSSIQLVLENLIIVLQIDLQEKRQKIEQLIQFKNNFYHTFLREYETEFYQNLQANWVLTIQKLLGILGGRIFSPIFYNEHEQIVYLTSMHKKLKVSYSLELIPQFISEDKKQYIKEMVLFCFNVQELMAYYKHLPLLKTQMHKLIIAALIILQSRLTSFCKKSYLEYSQNSLQQLEQQRADKKIVEQQKQFFQKYSNLLRKSKQSNRVPVAVRRKAINIATSNESSIFGQYKIIQKIKVIVRFIQYLMCFFNSTFKDYLANVEPNEQVEIYEKKLQGFEKINFQQGMNYKLKSILELSDQEETNQKQIYLAIFKRLSRLMFLLRIRQKNY